jgi:hypothetical protein
MSTDLEHRIRASAATLTMGRPVDDILAHGDRLRRRRRRGVLGAGAAVAVAAVGASIVLPPGSNPVVTSAVASWSGGRTNLTPKQLQEISDECLHGNHAEGSFPDGTLPVAAELRDDTVLAYFRHGDTELRCRGDVQGDDVARAGGFTGSYQPLPPGTDLGALEYGFSDPGVEGGPVTGLWDVSPVSDDVAGVTAEVGGKTYDAGVVDGVALIWISDRVTPEQADHLVLTAYDAQGKVLQRVGQAAE